jgi:hypothetical protein
MKGTKRTTPSRETRVTPPYEGGELKTPRYCSGSDFIMGA